MNRLIAALTLTVALALPVHPASATDGKTERFFPTSPVAAKPVSLYFPHTTAPVDEFRLLRVRTGMIQAAKVRRFVHRRTLNFAVAVQQAKDNAEARAAAVASEGNTHASQPTVVASYGSGACGGNLPPCSVMMCESGGSLTAQNPNSSASGKWQILDSTWANYKGYSRAMYAPESVQDERAAQIYAGGAGRSAWVC